VLILGSGTIALLCAQFAAAAGSEVHVLGIDEASLRLARELGATATWNSDDLPALRWDSVVDATDAPGMPSYAVEAVVPGAGGVDRCGSRAERPGLTSNRAQGVDRERHSGRLSGTCAHHSCIRLGAVDPHPLIGAVIGFQGIEAALYGHRPPNATAGPKVLFDPRR